jgi:O-antigen/teichoic acid export membrane protein
MSLKRNLIANYLGQGWVALMGIIFIPLYIKFLGIEAYGLIGLFAVLQAWLSLLDMGTTPTLGREMAFFSGGSRSVQSVRDLLRSVEALAFGIAVVIAVGIAFGAKWMATDWLKAEAIPVEEVEQAIVVMGLVTATRFMESVYRSSIIGLQRQVLFNVVNCTMATIRGLGAVGVLVWVSASIEAFFIWQGLVSISNLMVLAITTYASLPPAERAGKFSLSALRSVWKFAGGMFGITLLSLMLMQIDKIILSKILLLEDYGYYTLAAIVAGALYTVITPITQAFYPRLCELYARNAQAELINLYHHGTQLVSVFAGSVGIVVILYAETFLRLWTQDPEMARRTANLLSLLMLGNLLNGLMWIPYQTQLAHGWTNLAIRINTLSIAIVVPSILWVTPRFGAEGAALVWVCLNIGYILIGIHFMHRSILETEKYRWYIQDILKPLFAASASVGLLKILWQVESSNLSDIALLSLAAFLTFISTMLSASLLRNMMSNLMLKKYEGMKTNSWIKKGSVE